MEMNAQEKCDLNHFGYGLHALEAWRISPFIPVSVSLYISLPVSSKYMIYFMLRDTQHSKRRWT